MESSSQNDGKSCYVELSNSPQNSKSDTPRINPPDEPPEQWNPTSGVSSSPYTLHGPSKQHPHEGYAQHEIQKATGPHELNDTDTILSRKQSSYSESSNVFLIDDRIEIETDNDEEGTPSCSEYVRSDVLESTAISDASNEPLLQKTSYSSESNTLSFVVPVPLHRDETPSNDINNDLQYFGPSSSLFETISPENNSLKPSIEPVLTTHNPNVEQNSAIQQHHHQQPTTSSHLQREPTQQLLQTSPPKELTLEPSRLARLLYKPQSATRQQLVSQTKVVPALYTPPPSYQESLAYPAVQPHRSPLPNYSDYVTTEGCRCPALHTTHAKDPYVSVIRLSSSPPLRTQPAAMASVGSRDNVYVWQSPSDEFDSMDAHAHDQYSDHQILALLACIMFWPIGLVAIYYANMANILRSAGVHGKSMIYSKRALMLSLVSFIVGTCVYLTFYLQRNMAF